MELKCFPTVMLLYWCVASVAIPNTTDASATYNATGITENQGSIRNNIQRKSKGKNIQTDRKSVRDYPCPSVYCDCWYEKDPERVDVYCAFNAVDKSVSFHVFENVTFLSTLHVTCDELSMRPSVFQEFMFEGLTAFYALSFKGCNFMDVPEKTFYGLTNLLTLHIEKALNLAFDPNVFSYTPNLRRLNIIDSGISTVPSLCGLNMFELNATNNHIKTFVNTGLLCNESFTNMTYVDLSGNDLQTLPTELEHIVPNVVHLGLSENKLKYAAASSFQNLTKLGILELDSNQFRTLPCGLLRDNVQMTILRLSNNPLLSFPSGLFENMRQLQILYIRHSNINDTICEEIRNLTSLGILDLAENHITSINKDCLTNLTKLQLLDLSNNELSVLPDFSFSNQHLLHTLNLSSNTLAAVGNYMLHGLYSLQYLYLHNNVIQQTDDNSFQTLGSLLIANFSRNRLKSVPSFGYSPYLVILDMRRNEILYIDNRTFSGLSFLSGISLAYNKITTIPRNTFTSNRNLQMLQIEFNDIQTVSSLAFENENLQYLVLNNNELRDMSFLMQGNFKSLVEIDFRNNKIDCALFARLFPPTLERIYLSNNKIHGINSYAFHHLDKLQYVDLRSNSLTTLYLHSLAVSERLSSPPSYRLVGNTFFCDCHLTWLKRKIAHETKYGYFKYVITDLKSLFCRNAFQPTIAHITEIPLEHFVCNFTDYCNILCNCCSEIECDCRVVCPDGCVCYHVVEGVAITYVTCSQSNLTEIPEKIPALVDELNITNNVIRTVRAGALSTLETVRYINLSSNGISTIENNSFVGLVRLQTLDLSANDLQYLCPEMFVGLDALITLLINDNRIAEIIIHTFNSLSNLAELGLRGNELSKLSQSETKRMSKIDRLHVAGNPWSCDCKGLKEFLNFTRINAQNILDYKKMTCAGMNSTSGVVETFHIVDLFHYQICPNVTTKVSNFTTYHSRFVTPLATVLGVLVLSCIIAVVIFVNRDVIQVWLYIKFGWKFSRKEDENRQYDAFVSYSSLDEDFVVHELVPKLEGDAMGFSLCVHYRDFPVGASIAETIISSVEDSRRVIVVLSNNFLDSEWCQYEFQTAHHQVLSEKKNRIIMILLSDLDNSKLDKELREYIKTRTYVEYKDPWFWKKIKYAMPHKVKQNAIGFHRENSTLSNRNSSVSSAIELDYVTCEVQNAENIMKEIGDIKK